MSNLNQLIDQTKRDLCIAWMERYRCLVMEGIEPGPDGEGAAEIAAREIGWPVMELSAWTIRILQRAFEGQD